MAHSLGTHGALIMHTWGTHFEKNAPLWAMVLPRKKKESSDILLSTKFLVVNFDSPDNRNLGHHLLSYSPDIFREIVVNKQIEIFDKKLCVSKMIFLFGFPEKKKS